MNDVVNSAVAYMEQLIYIMDPENFIIRKESNQSIHETRKASLNPKRDQFRKTVIRPHYICLNEKELTDFLLDNSKEKEPRAFHPVRGHWRNLISDYYKNKRGQKIFIEQYFRGKSNITGKDGWHYQVLIKTDPITLEIPQ